MDVLRHHYTNDDLQKQEADFEELSDDFEDRKSELIEISNDDNNIKGKREACVNYNPFNLTFLFYLSLKILY
jgi:tRNA/tmRNA/rRNA uracil-C5-methylase (TrmA/RlmC/RlmD family)